MRERHWRGLAAIDHKQRSCGRGCHPTKCIGENGPPGTEQSAETNDLQSGMEIATGQAALAAAQHLMVQTNCSRTSTGRGGPRKAAGQ